MFRNVRMSPATTKSRKTRMLLIICEAPIPFATLRLSPKIVNEKNHSFTHSTGGNPDRKTQEIQRKNTLSTFCVSFICRWLRLLASQHQMRTNAKYKYKMRIQDKYKINDLFTSLPVAHSPPNSSPSNTRHRIASLGLLSLFSVKGWTFGTHVVPNICFSWHQIPFLNCLWYLMAHPR